MFDRSKILSCACDEVGWIDSANPDIAALGGTLTNSTSGLFFNNLPGVELGIINDCFSNDYASLTSYLTVVQDACINDIVSDFVDRYKNDFLGKQLLSHHPVVSGVADMKDTIIQDGRFMGYLIGPLASDNIKISITHLSLQVNQIQTGAGVRIYLYETSQVEAIATFDFINAAAFSLDWQAVTDFIANYQSLTGGTGQEYLLGYYEADANNPQAVQLEGKAIQMNFDCGCSGNPQGVIRKYMRVEPLIIENGYLAWNAGTGNYDLPDIDGFGFTSQIHGLQCKFNVECDITDVICANIGIFAKPLQYAVAAKVLLDVFASTHINSITESKKNQSMEFSKKYEAELRGFTDSETGVFTKGMLHSLVIDFQGLDKQCLPCVQKGPMVGKVKRSAGCSNCG